MRSLYGIRRWKFITCAKWTLNRVKISRNYYILYCLLSNSQYVCRNEKILPWWSLIMKKMCDVLLYLLNGECVWMPFHGIILLMVTQRPINYEFVNLMKAKNDISPYAAAMAYLAKMVMIFRWNSASKWNLL